MKTKIFSSMLLISLIVMVMSGCNQRSSTKESKEKTTTSVDTVVLRNQITELIRQSPKGIATMEFLNDMGVTYIDGLALSLADAGRYETIQELAMAAGAYGADMNYASMCQRLDLAAQYGELVINFLGKLGVQNNMPVTVKNLEGISSHVENQDSVAAYVERAMTIYHQEQNANSPEIYPLIFIGANVEIFYLLTQLTLYSNNRTALIERVSGQGDIVRTMLDLLEILSVDETIKPYHETMKPLADYFNEHSVFTEKELKEIAPIIEGIRNDMLL